MLASPRPSLRARNTPSLPERAMSQQWNRLFALIARDGLLIGLTLLLWAWTL